MPTKFGECSDCTIYIDGNEFHGIPAFEGSLEPAEDYIKDSIKFHMNPDKEATFTATCKIDRLMIYKLIGLYDWVLTNCPEKRVVHLTKYAKKVKVRRKNFKHAIRLIEKLYN